MKNLILPILLLAAGCEVRTRLEVSSETNAAPSTVEVSRYGNSYNIVKHTIEGHEYFVPRMGGIIHSESCTNSACLPLALEKLREVQKPFYFQKNSAVGIPTLTLPATIGEVAE